MTNKILKEALKISMEEDLENVTANESLEKDHIFSPAFEKKMQTLIKKTNKKHVKIKRLRVRKSIIAASLILIIVTGFMTVEGVRIPMIKLTEKIYAEFSEIFFENHDNIQVPQMIEEVYIPGYIPEGYVLTEEVDEMRSMHFLFYTNDKGQRISVEQLVFGVHMAVDTEDIVTEEITINDMNGIIYTKRGLTSIIVNDNRYVHFVSGYESREELIKIVESLHIEK